VYGVSESARNSCALLALALPVTIANQMRREAGIIGVALSLAVGCGGSAYPEPSTTRSRVAIGAAEALGAQQVPRAELHLKLAREQLVTAERLMEDDEDDKAFLVLGRAEVDARLAQALARDAALQREAAQAMQRVQDLQREAKP
jgi:hypothetical protein